jgi:hypothetical protein
MGVTGEPVSASWLQAPNERDRLALLEYTRGVLYSLSFSREDDIEKGRAIHVGRIRSAFCNLGAPTLYRLGLRLLHLLREVEPLFGGYWLLTPFRVVEIESHFVFVGSVPSVSGLLGDMRHDGMARYITQEVASRFPRQNINSWMGLHPTTTAQQISRLVSTHRKLVAPTIHSQDVEFFKAVGNSVYGRRFVWTQQPHAILSDEKIALCRHKQTGIYRYFSGELRSGVVVGEAPIEQSIARLMFALGNHRGFPVPAAALQHGECTKIRISERLPIEEYRLALLLAADISRLGNATSYTVETSLAPALFKQLSDLGCSLETSN